MKKPVTKSPAAVLTPQQRAALPVMTYIAAHHDAVWHAVRLIGGYEQCRLVDRLAQALQDERRLTPRIRVMLDQLMDLLTLEPTADDRCIAFGGLVPIDPADPAVEEICLLTDGLSDALDAAEALLRDAPRTPARQAA